MSFGTRLDAGSFSIWYVWPGFLAGEDTDQDTDNPAHVNHIVENVKDQEIDLLVMEATRFSETNYGKAFTNTDIQRIRDEGDVDYVYAYMSIGEIDNLRPRYVNNVEGESFDLGLRFPNNPNATQHLLAWWDQGAIEMYEEWADQLLDDAAPNYDGIFIDVTDLYNTNDASDTDERLLEAILPGAPRADQQFDAVEAMLRLIVELDDHLEANHPGAGIFVNFPWLVSNYRTFGQDSASRAVDETLIAAFQDSVDAVLYEGFPFPITADDEGGETLIADLARLTDPEDAFSYGQATRFALGFTDASNGAKPAANTPELRDAYADFAIETGLIPSFNSVLFDGPGIPYTVERTDLVGPPQPWPLTPNSFGTLLPDTPTVTYSSGSVVQVVDAAGGQVLEVQVGASLYLQDASGANTLVLPGNADDFLISGDGVTVTLQGPGLEFIIFDAGTTAQTLVFEDGALDIQLQGDAVAAGTQIVAERAASLTSPLDPAPSLPPQPGSPPGDPNYFGIATELSQPQTVDSGVFARFIDAPGTDVYRVDPGASLDLQGSAGANLFSMMAFAADVQISHTAGKVTLSGLNGQSVTFHARTAPQTVSFFDGQADIQIQGTMVVAGDQMVTGTPAPIVTESASIAAGVTTPSGIDDLLFL